MRSALLLLVVSACASPGPHREFHDGAPVRTAPMFAAPGATPAGAGLPEYFAHPTEGVPRGEDRRVLPPQKEPGIWASGGRVELGSPVLLGVLLPYPAGADAEEDKRPTQLCAAVMRHYIHQLPPLAGVDTQPEDHKACLAARLYFHCAAAIVNSDIAGKRTATSYDALQAARNLKMHATADAFMRKKCAGLTDNPEVIEPYGVIDWVVTRWLADLT